MTKRQAQKLIRKHGRQWALNITALLEGFGEEMDLNSYDLAQEFIREMRSIWKRQR